MALEFLLCTHHFARPRQFVVHSDRRFTGALLNTLLSEHFGAGPWFYAGRALVEHPEFTEQDIVIITDMPVLPTPREDASLKLYVLDGPNAGAQLSLRPGHYRIGRTAPLWLEDPAVARVHATVVVDDRHIMLYPEPGRQVHLLPGPGAEVTGAVRLQRGSTIQLGDSTLRVQDPLAELDPTGTRWPLDLPGLPEKPQLQRLLAMLAAALLPVAIGILLAVLTGSVIFLLLSTLSALLAIFPAVGMWRSRRAYRRALREHTEDCLAARTRVAPPLGTVLAAAADPLREAYPVGEARLVLGRGRWYAQLQERTGQRVGPGEPSAIFALKATGAWQLVAEPGPAAVQVLCAILARFLPAVLGGGPALVLDPAIPLLPANLLLLPGVSLGLPPPAAGPVSGRAQKTACEVIYVIAGTAYPIAGALVLGLGLHRAPTVDGWVELSGHSAAPGSQLDDPQTFLEQLDWLSLPHFTRLVESWLTRLRPAALPRALTPVPGRIRCVIGDDEQGQPVELDLDADGPHFLVAGTTGSGKSEALRRIVSELVSQQSPRELALALVDFKGGASLSVFAAVPHTQLFVSDLDGAAAQRMLDQLDLEIRRRERLLQSAGCSDIADYPPQPEDAPALPRLLVVVDEFRVFIDQLAEASARIDRIATVGRALGIHLLLSTQKPTGTLSSQTRANINTVIALRVRDASESSDLVDCPQAAQLAHPGEAILRTALRGPLLLRFYRAAPGKPTGYLAERASSGLGEYHRKPLGPESMSGSAMDGLREKLLRVHTQWGALPPLPSPFAPPLPQNVLEEPPGQPEHGQVICGVLDQLEAGRLAPLPLAGKHSPALLVAGLPEAGPTHLVQQLLRSGVKALCFDAAPDPGWTAPAQQLLITGRDTYLFRQALDYLADPEQLAGLLIIVRQVAGLVAALPPNLWARFDELLANLIRSGSRTGAQVIILGDRDLSLLKASSLCTRRWYFPLGAPMGLSMSWPKLPPVSTLVGRGVQVSEDGQLHSIQLTKLSHEPVLSPERWRAPALSVPTDTRWWLGVHGLAAKPAKFCPSGIGFIIVPDAVLRQHLARTLCARWDLQLCRDQQELASSESPALICDVAPTPPLAQLLNSLAAQGARPVVFCAPSARLAYEFALPSLSLDERDVLVVEATHPYDMQPLLWPALAEQPESEIAGVWRAVKLIGGQPAEVLIPQE